jgi:hypothetical protein
MFLSKDRAYSSEAPLAFFHVLDNWQPPDLTDKHLTKVKRLAREEHSSFFSTFVIYNKKVL